MKIICPICNLEMQKDEKRYFCPNNHSFDIAKEGYVNLAMQKTDDTGDTKEAMLARRAFLEKDYYAFLKNAINDYISTFNVERLTDLACGEGYYTKDLRAPYKIGVDLSKKGLKLAAKKDRSTTYILASIFHTPIESFSQDMILTCFAPVAEKEIVRLLKDDAYFLLIRPASHHMFELKQAIYDIPYLNDEKILEIEGLKLVEEKNIEDHVTLNKDDMMNLFMMTPYFYKTSLKDKSKLDSIDTLDITFAFHMSLYQKNKQI